MDPFLPLRITPGSHVGPDGAENPENLKKTQNLITILEAFGSIIGLELERFLETFFERVLRALWNNFPVDF